MRKKALLIIIIIFATTFIVANSQEKLIDFTIKPLEKNSIEISWTNPYSNTIQLSIQRSPDNKNFRTILSAPKPGMLNNKIIDATLPIGGKFYYRIYYVLAGGNFYFSNTLNTTDNLIKIDSKQALSIDNTIETDITNNTLAIKQTLPNIDKKNTNNQQIPEFINLTKATTLIKDPKQESLETIEPAFEYYYHTPIKNREIVKLNLNLGYISSSVQKIKKNKSNIQSLEYIFIYQKDSLITRLDPTGFLKLKDSLRLKTKDTLYVFNKAYATIHPYIPVYVWNPSLYVFNTKKGEPTIQIATAKKHNYRLVFKDEKGLFLFQLSPIKEEQLFLDKSNFLHAGWFEFELYEDEKLLEMNKIFIQ